MFKKTISKAAAAIAKSNGRPRVRRIESGVVEEVSGAVARLSGLSNVGLGELVDAGGTSALVMRLGSDWVGVAAMDASSNLASGMVVRRTGSVASVPVGEQLLGRIVSPLGEPLDGGRKIITKKRLPIEREVPPIINRAAIDTPMQTGILAVDSMLPIGRGQRELILGDRQTGKTALAIDSIIAQKNTGVVCIYCAIGGQTDSVAKAISAIKEHGNFDNCIVVSASGESSPALLYIAPYAATSMAEYFAEQGRDVLIVYDTLSAHATAYRQLSLLLKRPPGREAYPGDIFYIHSRLLERSAKLAKKFGGGSITALPICETFAENIAAYIPTNLISITDGQIFLSNQLFQKGIIPAINIGVSVSRVGGRAQLPAYKSAAGEMKIQYSQFEELEVFSKFGTTLDESTKAQLIRGERTREILKQPQFLPLSAGEQTAITLALNAGLFDKVPPAKMAAAKSTLVLKAKREMRKVLGKIESGRELDTKDLKEILRLSREALTKFSAKGKNADAPAT